MKYILDTNVYFRTISDTEWFTKHRLLLAMIMPRTWLCSVVHHELLAGARGDLGRAAIRRAFRTLERVGRTVAPTHADWTVAASVRGRIWEHEPWARTKQLQNDVLIACCSRRIGAVVITENFADYVLIGRYFRHQATPASELARKLGAS